jgi:hypothetical protein
LISKRLWTQIDTIEKYFEILPRILLAVGGSQDENENSKCKEELHFRTKMRPI